MLIEKSLEPREQSINEIHHLVERIKNQLAFGNLRLSERYIDSQLKILVLLLFVSGSREVGDFVAYHESHKSMLVKVKRDAASHIDKPLVHCSGDSEQQSMLVHNVELMDEPKRLVESNVWLYRLDDLSRIGRDLLYFSLAYGRFVLLGRLRNRKICVSVGSPAANFDKLPDDMVKCAPKIVDSISDDEREMLGNGFDGSDVKSCVMNGRYMVRLGPESIRITSNELLNSNIQATDVLFGPFNFQSDSVTALLRAHYDFTQSLILQVRPRARFDLLSHREEFA